MRFDEISGKDYRMLLENCPFSDEECAIFDMKRRKKSNIEIAGALHLSDRTVSRRMEAIRRKINSELA